MPAFERFVRITNKCSTAIRIYFTFLKPKKGRQPQLTPFDLNPGDTSRPVPYMRLVGAKDWDDLCEKGCILLKDVIWTPPFAFIENKQTEPLELALPLPPKRKQKEGELKQILVPPSEQSGALYIPRLIQRARLKVLAKRKEVSIVPVPHIGPRIGEPPAVRSYGYKVAVGSYGYDDVFVCWDCGGPIIFRYNPPVPIHVG